MTEDITNAQKIIVDILQRQDQILGTLTGLNENLIKSSDDRMEVFAQTVREFTHTINGCSQMVKHLEKTYTAHIQQALDSRDSFKDAYVKLLHKYEKLEEDYFSTLKELARRPTITNKTGE